VTYFVFTDGTIPESSDIVPLFQKRLGWPYDTMMRTHVYYKHASTLLTQDYLFACDADMLFVDTVGDEILGERVATMHPGFVGMRGSYYKNPRSLSHVDKWEGEHYFAGGFYGGSAQEMLRISYTLSMCIDEDLRRGIIAEWHDEAHWNRYCIDYPPTVILSPSYCYPENWKLKYPKKLLALDKNHTEIRKSE
jgi:histo-blood group ABO system transferase